MGFPRRGSNVASNEVCRSAILFLSASRPTDLASGSVSKFGNARCLGLVSSAICHSRTANGRESCSRFLPPLGLSEDKYDLETEPRNPSLDIAILHVLSKNPHLFSGVYDNSLMLALTRALSKKFRSKNVRMLSPEQEARSKNVFVTKISGY